MLFDYTLEHMRQEWMQVLRNPSLHSLSDADLSEAQKQVRILDAIPESERNSRLPLLSPELRRCIAVVTGVTVADVDCVVNIYKMVAASKQEMRFSEERQIRRWEEYNNRRWVEE